MNGFKQLLITGIVWITALPVFGQTQTRKYDIEVAGLRIGNMHITQTSSPTALVYDLISDVEFWFFGKIKVYYKTVSRHDPATRQLLRSDTDAKTSRGNYQTDIVWQNGRYDINANQYKYQRKATDSQPIEFTISRLYFEEPVGLNRVFAEYFGNYASVEPTKKGSYRVRIDDREDEYFYEKGQLVRIVKKNPIKNYTIRRVE
ncbi:DUF6134 family protein [Larkinella sp. VNQ87]|uniref:DUF6134 family protein n=1 Tax=Larkinella sp. VNQ87 TaxID=3400921 RepID=UPI003BFF0857